MTVFGVVLICSLQLITAQTNVEQNRISNNNLQGLVGQLAARVSQLEARDGKHTETAARANEEIMHLRRELATQQEMMGNMATLLATQTEELHTLKKIVANTKDKTHGPQIRRQENEANVAFYAELQNNATHILGYKQDVVFNNAIVNVGNAYNIYHGMFTAPVTGIYVFSTTLMTETRNDTHFAITINAKPITYMKLFGTEHMYDTTSQTVVYSLQAGDTVSVTHTEAGKALHGMYTTFSGFLLQQLFTSGPAIVG